MKKDNKQKYDGSTKVDTSEGIGIRTDLDTKHLFDTVDRYAGDSVNEHKQMEEANEHFASEEIEQVNNNL